MALVYKHSIICLLVLTVCSCSLSDKEKLSSDKLAFLCGAILGDNLIWVIIKKPISVQKRMLFDRCNYMLGLPEDSNIILMKAIWKDGIPAQESVSNALYAISKYEAYIRSKHGKRVADTAILGSIAIRLFTLAQSLELTPPNKNSNRDSVARAFLIDIQNLKKTSNDMDLPDNVVSHLQSLPYYENIDSSEAKIIKNALIEILALYDVKPMTNIIISNGNISITDADISGIVDKIK